MSDDKIIRQVEGEVLDRVHLGHGTFKLSEGNAVHRILKILGDFYRDLDQKHQASLSGEPLDLSALRYQVQFTLAGISHCVRWATQNCPSGGSALSADWEKEEETVVNLVRWSVGYAQLSTDHIAWGHGLQPARVDCDKRAIHFGPKLDADLTWLRAQANVEEAWWNSFASSIPQPSFASFFQAWAKSLQFSRGGIDPDPTFGHDRLDRLQMIDWVSSHLLPELPDDEPLGGYSLGQLRQCLGALILAGKCFAELEANFDKKFGKENAMGSWVFSLPHKDTVEWFSALSGVARDHCEAIVADLTFSPNIFQSTLSATPIVRTRTDDCFVLTGQLARLHPERTFVAAMTQGSGRTQYDRISTILEKKRLNEIAKVLSSHYSVLVSPTFSAEGVTIQPDLIVFDGKRMAIVEFKNYLAAISVNDIRNRLREIRKGKEQLKRYSTFAKDFETLISGRFPGRPAVSNATLAKIILTYLPLALPIEIDEIITVQNWTSWKRSAAQGKLQTIEDLLEIRRSDGSRAAPATSVEWFEHSITAGDWTYIRHLPSFK